MNSSYNVSPNTADEFGGLQPIGSVLMWTTPTAPNNYLLCNGSAISRTLFNSLFLVLGTLYGAGDGSTTFNLPDCGNRTIRGAGSTYAQASAGGADSVNLIDLNLPIHGHSLIDPGHNHPAVFQGSGFASSPGSFGNTCSAGGTTGNAVTGITLVPSVRTAQDVQILPAQRVNVNIVNPFLTLSFIIRAT